MQKSDGSSSKKSEVIAFPSLAMWKIHFESFQTSCQSWLNNSFIEPCLLSRKLELECRQMQHVYCKGKKLRKVWSVQNCNYEGYQFGSLFGSFKMDLLPYG
ncbi:unnamed protein product [Ilex paraguariensis]|uniref:Uncharacterized protein n=1 Tax=Ilex paraguariensis TaxID=185542 RepID=A0ABC8QSH0_9AQUA